MHHCDFGALARKRGVQPSALKRSIHVCGARIAGRFVFLSGTACAWTYAALPSYSSLPTVLTRPEPTELAMPFSPMIRSLALLAQSLFGVFATKKN